MLNHNVRFTDSHSALSRERPGYALQLIDLRLDSSAVVVPDSHAACPEIDAVLPKVEPEFVLKRISACSTGGTYRYVTGETNCGDIEFTDEDTDADGIGDACDNCIFDVNLDQADQDLDGVGNVCDATTAPCSDGIDNDGDGLVDLDDPGCDSPGDLSENNSKHVCDNGIDDDLDGHVDLDDPDCSSATDDSEAVDDPTERDGLPTWNSSTQYWRGDRVEYDGKIWEVIHSSADPGWPEPDDPTLWAVWELVGEC